MPLRRFLYPKYIMIVQSCLFVIIAIIASMWGTPENIIIAVIGFAVTLLGTTNLIKNGVYPDEQEAKQKEERSVGPRSPAEERQREES